MTEKTPKNGNGIQLEEALAAIDGSRGNVTKIADNIGCVRQHVYVLRKKWSTFDQAIIDEKEKFKDLIETTIEDECLAKNTTMLIFYAKTQMKDRGYIERQELTGRDGEGIVTGPINIIVNEPLQD